MVQPGGWHLWIRDKILAKLSVAIPPSHLVQTSENLKNLLYDQEVKPDLKTLNKDYPEYSKDNKSIPNNVHFNISVLQKMEEALLEQFQDFSETNEPIINRTFTKQHSKKYTNDEYLEFYKEGKTRKKYWLDLKEQSF